MSYQPHEHLIQTLKFVENVLDRCRTEPRLPLLTCDECGQMDASVRLRGWSGFEMYVCDYCEDTARDRAQDAKAVQHRMERS